MNANVGPHWPVYVINLAEARERLNSVTEELHRVGLDFRRIEAVPAGEVSPDIFSRVYDGRRNRRSAKAPLSRPEIACYLSHIKAWQTIAASDAPGAVVLEDDFIAHAALPGVIGELAADTAAWDIVKLYSTPRTSGPLVRRLSGGFRLVDARIIPARTIAYAITTETARRLAETAIPFARPVDQDLKHWWEKDLRVLSVIPSPIDLDERHLETSLIEKERASSKSGHEGGRYFRRMFRHLRYQVRFRAGLFANRHRRH